MDVFSNHCFAYATSSQNAETVARVIINIMTKHVYPPARISFDEKSDFVSQVIKEVAEVLGITLQHATTKHAQTIGMLERKHASLKKAL